MRLPALVSSAFVLTIALAGPAVAAGGDPYSPLQWGLRSIRAQQAWRVGAGGGAVVAVVDTGVDASHPDLAGRVLPGIDLVDDDDDPADENGHGTLTAGIVAAATGNGIGVASVAPNARIMPVRVLDADGVGTPADLAAGIAWASEHGAHVINLSLAQDAARGSIDNLLSDPRVDRAIVRAARAGAVVVVAAGNAGDGGRSETSYDAVEPGVLVVGAVTRSRRPAAYANFGSGLDLVAPGGGSPTDPSDAACTEDTGIVSTWWNPATRASSYGAGCGTSMAVAFVSGVAASLRASGVDNVVATSRILASARDLGTPGFDPRTGAGLLDAARALREPPLRASGRVVASSRTIARGLDVSLAASSEELPSRAAPIGLAAVSLLAATGANVAVRRRTGSRTPRPSAGSTR